MVSATTSPAWFIAASATAYSPAQRGGVGLGGQTTFLGAPRLVNHDGDIHLLGKVKKAAPRGILETFDVDSHYSYAGVFPKVVHQIAWVYVHLIAVGDHHLGGCGIPQVGNLHQSEGPALGKEGEALLSAQVKLEFVLRNEKGVHPRAAGAWEDHPQAVGAQNPNARILGDSPNFPFNFLVLEGIR